MAQARVGVQSVCTGREREKRGGRVEWKEREMEGEREAEKWRNNNMLFVSRL